jgi:hypothetical protein
MGLAANGLEMAKKALGSLLILAGPLSLRFWPEIANYTYIGLSAALISPPELGNFS